MSDEKRKLFNVHDILILRCPHLEGTEHYESRFDGLVTFRGYTTNRSDAGTARCMVSPVDRCLQLEVDAEWLSREGDDA